MSAQQKYQQVESNKFANYELAKAAFDKLECERKRIRRRADGTFDLVRYESLESLKEKKNESIQNKKPKSKSKRRRKNRSAS